MIQQSLLNELADTVGGKVKKVVINGTYEITEFVVHQVTGSVLGLNYVVPVTEVSLITLIELKDADNNLVTSNHVNIPIAADHIMLQTITVKEAL